MYRIRLYPHSYGLGGYGGYNSYNTFGGLGGYRSYGGYGSRGYSLHVVDSPSFRRRRRINMVREQRNIRRSVAQNAARINALYGVNGLYNRMAGINTYGSLAVPFSGYGLYSSFAPVSPYASVAGYGMGGYSNAMSGCADSSYSSASAVYGVPAW